MAGSSSNKRMRLTSSLEDELAQKVRAVISGPPETVTKIVEYLISPEVGITSLEELQYLTKDMLPASVVAPIKAVQLLTHFKQPPNSSNSTEAGSSTGSDQTPAALRPPAVNRAESTRASGFTFTVPWNTLPKKELDNLDLSEKKRERGSQNDIDTVKLEIVKKLVSSYNSYKEDHPGQKKHPGVKAYDNITQQCFVRYKFALTDFINGRQVGDGKASFRRAVHVSTENMMRQKNKEKASSCRAVQNRGTVGVLPEEYLPQIIHSDRRGLEQIREELQSIGEDDRESWDWERIRTMQMESYSLQREDIMNALNKINQQQEKDKSDEEPDEPEEKAVSELLQLWPFLFTVGGLKWHHDRLTDRPRLTDFLEEFIDNHLDSLLLFLTSCCKNRKANAANSAINAQLENKVKDWTPDRKLLKAFYMLANYFSEKHEVLMHKVEQTTSPCEIDTTGLRDLCIIAHAKHPFDAKNFFIATDEVIISKANSFTEALTSLIYIAFILDLEYPKMPLVFEFVERYIYGLGIPDTKVKCKKGKQIVVVTPAVREMLNAFKQYEDDIGNELEIFE